MQQHTCNMECNRTILHDLDRKYLSPAYAIEFSIGFPANLLVIVGYVFCLPKWQSYNIYLLNLAVSDLLFLCMLPRLSFLYANDESETNPVACILNRYLLHVNLYSSILFMVWLSMDRYLLIKHPTKSHFLLRRRTAYVITGLSWFVVNLEVMPMISLMVQDLRRHNWSSCNDFASLKGGINTFDYSLGLTITGYILPLLGLCYFSYQIKRLLRAQEQAMPRSKELYKRPLRVATSAAAMFFVLYTPYHVMRNVRIAYEHGCTSQQLDTYRNIEIVYIVTRPLAFLHSVINPVFYFFMGDKFRELFLAKIRKLFGKKVQREN